MSLNGLTSENCLFLVCPTDFMEPALRKNCQGQAFFYTALGACFDWNLSTQKNLIGLIKRRNIGQIVLVTKMDNRFFRDKVKVKYNLAHFPVEKALQSIEDSLPEHFHHWDKPLPQLSVLALHYLNAQKRRLLDSEPIGQLIQRKQISIEIQIYDAKKRSFLNMEKLEGKIHLFDSISVN